MIGYKEAYYSALKKIGESLPKCFGENLLSLVVFGSVAKETFSPESDIDLLVILEDFKSKREEYVRLFECLEELKKVNPIILNKEQLRESLWFLWDCKFIILYDKEGFFDSFVERLKEFLRKNVVKVEGGMPYYEVIDGKP